MKDIEEFIIYEQKHRGVEIAQEVTELQEVLRRIKEYKETGDVEPVEV